MTLVQRFDVATPSERTRLPGTGAFRLTGELTKSGVFVYQDASGREVREWRPPEEVSKADSVASIEDVPVTIGHPPGGVTPETYDRLAVGHGRSPQVVASGSDVVVRGTLTAARKDAADGVASGRYTETSMGYACRLDETPGTTPDGRPYDRVQRDIVYNHVALLPAGRARLGTRLDSGEMFVPRLDAAGNQIASSEGQKSMSKITIKRDGKDLEVGAEDFARLEAERDAARARADEAEKANATYKADEAKRAHDALVATAAGVLGKDFKADGLSDRQIRERVIAKRLPAIKCDGKDDAYVATVFDAALAVSAPAAAPKTGSQVAVVHALTRGDAAEPAGEPDGDEDFMKKAKEKASKADSAWERG